MEIDTSNLTNEQISKLGEFIHSMEEENTKAIKWWIMPKYPIFGSEVEMFGQQYYIEPEEDTYSRSTPPLKSGFESAEKAREWLNNYLAEEDLFLKAIDEINTLKNNLGSLIQKLRNHQYITNTDIHNCFESFNESWDKGPISRVIKTECRMIQENDNYYFDKNGEKKPYSPDAINYARERVSYELSYTYGMGFTDEQRDWIANHIFVSVRKTYQDVLDKQVEYKGTDLELANKYFDEECKHSYADNEEQLKEDVVSAFLKGLKIGREEVTKE